MRRRKRDTAARLLPVYIIAGLFLIIASIPAYGYILGVNTPTDSSPFVSLLRNGVIIGGIKTAFSSMLVPLVVNLLVRIKYAAAHLEDAIAKQMTEVHFTLVFEVFTVILAPIVSTLLLDGAGPSLVLLWSTLTVFCVLRVMLTVLFGHCARAERFEHILSTAQHADMLTHTHVALCSIDEQLAHCAIRCALLASIKSETTAPDWGHARAGADAYRQQFCSRKLFSEFAIGDTCM